MCSGVVLVWIQQKKMAESKTNKYVGRRISKEFEDHGIYHGTVDSFDAEYDIWHITYDDGDAEEMKLSELLLSMDFFQGKGGRSYIGHRVSRQFGSTICDGKISKFDYKQCRWEIAYNYGGVGEMDHQELLYARHLFHNKEIEVPEKPMHQQTSCPSKEKKGERDDGIQLFAFKSDDSAAKMRCGPERPK